MSPQIHPHPVILAPQPGPNFACARPAGTGPNGPKWRLNEAKLSGVRSVNPRITSLKRFQSWRHRCRWFFLKLGQENKHMGSTNLPETNKKVHPEKLKVGRWFMSFWEISSFQGAFAVRFGGGFFRFRKFSMALHNLEVTSSCARKQSSLQPCASQHLT